MGEKGCVDIPTAPLTPLHDLREVRGSYLELTDRRTYEALPPTIICTSP